MEAHKYAQLFPMASEGELAEMAADIKQRGLLHPIITVNGQILDGRNRFKACELAGVTPDFREYEGVDPLADVISWNLHRRQLSTSQRAALGAELKPMFEAEAQDRMLAGTKYNPVANLPQGGKSRFGHGGGAAGRGQIQTGDGPVRTVAAAVRGTRHTWCRGDGCRP